MTNQHYLAVAKLSHEHESGGAASELNRSNAPDCRSLKFFTKNSWAFAGLGAKVEYEAQLIGVTVIYVDPRNTSRTCPNCRHVEKAKRKTRDRFECVRCGSVGSADHFAAKEISSRSEVKRPYAGEIEFKVVHTALHLQAHAL